MDTRHQTMMMLEFIDPFYKKDMYRNVFGVIKPQAGTKCRIISVATQIAYKIHSHGNTAGEDLSPHAARHQFRHLGSSVPGSRTDPGSPGVAVDDAHPRQWRALFQITVVDVIFLLSCTVGYPFLLWVANPLVPLGNSS